MNLNKIKKDIKDIKDKAGITSEPTMRNFCRYCERYYGRKVMISEIMFSQYKLPNGQTVKSEPLKFIRLSEEYFNKIHNTENPLKADTGLTIKTRKAIRWQESQEDTEFYKMTLPEVIKCKEYNQWFESWWNSIIEDETINKELGLCQ